jgi:hypothetical protein
MLSPEDGQRDQHAVSDNKQDRGKRFAATGEVGKAGNEDRSGKRPVEPRATTRQIAVRPRSAGKIGFDHKRGSVGRLEMRVNPTPCLSKTEKVLRSGFLALGIVQFHPVPVAAIHDRPPPGFVGDIPFDGLEKARFE